MVPKKFTIFKGFGIISSFFGTKNLGMGLAILNLYRVRPGGPTRTSCSFTPSGKKLALFRGAEYVHTPEKFSGKSQVAFSQV